MNCKHRADLMNEVVREFYNNTLRDYIDGRYRESKHFRKAVMHLVINICELNPTNKVGNIIHEFLKTPFFEKQEYRKGVFKQIRYEILPVLWKNRRAVERKKQKKLTFLADELEKAGRVVEAHVVRTIVKPHIRDMNLKWSKMTAVDKLRTCDFKKQPCEKPKFLTDMEEACCEVKVVYNEDLHPWTTDNGDW